MDSIIKCNYYDLTALFSFVYLKNSELFKKDQISFNHVLKKSMLFYLLFIFVIP
jgi:hypothetical protein